MHYQRSQFASQTLFCLESRIDQVSILCKLPESHNCQVSKQSRSFATIAAGLNDNRFRSSTHFRRRFEMDGIA